MLKKQNNYHYDNVYCYLGLFLFIFLFFLSSCASTSPFLKNGKTNALLLCGNEGDIVVYVNLRKNRDLFAKYIKTDKSNLSRFSDAVIVSNSKGTYGIIEGDIPEIAKGIIANKLGGKWRVVDKLGRYEKKNDDGSIFSFNLVYPGVILFSIGDYRTAYENFVSLKKEKMTKAISSVLQSHEVSVFGIRPDNSNMEMFKSGILEGLILTLDYIKERDRIRMNGIFQLTSKESFESMQVTFKNDFIKYIKNGGDRLEMLYAMKCCKFSLEDLAISYENYDMPMQMLLLMME